MTDASDVKICQWKSKGLKYEYNNEYWILLSILAPSPELLSSYSGRHLLLVITLRWWCKRITVWSQIMQCWNVVWRQGQGVEMNSGSDQPNQTKCENSQRNQQVQKKYSAHTLGLLEIEYTVYCNIVKTRWCKEQIYLNTSDFYFKHTDEVGLFKHNNSPVFGPSQCHKIYTVWAYCKNPEAQ